MLVVRVSNTSKTIRWSFSHGKPIQIQWISFWSKSIRNPYDYIKSSIPNHFQAVSQRYARCIQIKLRIMPSLCKPMQTSPRPFRASRDASKIVVCKAGSVPILFYLSFHDNVSTNGMRGVQLTEVGKKLVASAEAQKKKMEPMFSAVWAKPRLVKKRKFELEDKTSTPLEILPICNKTYGFTQLFKKPPKAGTSRWACAPAKGLEGSHAWDRRELKSFLPRCVRFMKLPSLPWGNRVAILLRNY